MSRPVQRSQIVDYATYAERRDAAREHIFAVKAVRRIHLGDVLTFLFENNETMLYQVQEMMLAERIVKESAVQHEIDTYNDLLGGRGELACSLLIEIDSPPERAEKLRRWLPLPKHLYVRLEDGTQVRATFDPSQIGEDRLSAVQYLKFDTQGRTPVAIGCDFPELANETQLTDEQRRALRADLEE